MIELVLKNSQGMSWFLFPALQKTKYKVRYIVKIDNIIYQLASDLSYLRNMLEMALSVFIVSPILNLMSSMEFNKYFIVSE